MALIVAPQEFAAAMALEQTLSGAGLGEAGECAGRNEEETEATWRLAKAAQPSDDATPAAHEEDGGASTDSGSEKAFCTSTSAGSASASDDEDFAQLPLKLPPPPSTPPPPAPTPSALAHRPGAPPGLPAPAGLGGWGSFDEGEELPEEEGRRRGAELLSFLSQPPPSAPEGGDDDAGKRKLTASAKPFVPQAQTMAAVADKPFAMRALAAAQPFVPKPQHATYVHGPSAWTTNTAAATKMCWEFASYGMCPRGGACRWLHVAR
mmetsp:Transcript_36094/g.103792  ORF Transcript_36094/g.103792 Transcript_36094/m.103792 type:complete len:264 (-) Transcript_36094:139-930(-)